MTHGWRFKLALAIAIGSLSLAWGQKAVNMDNIMSSDDQRRTGVWRLSKAERQALEVWLTRWKAVVSDQEGRPEQQLFVDWSAKVAEEKAGGLKTPPSSSSSLAAPEPLSGPSTPKAEPEKGYGDVQPPSNPRYP